MDANEERFQQYLHDARMVFKIDESVARMFWNGGRASIGIAAREPEGCGICGGFCDHPAEHSPATIRRPKE